MGMPLPGTWRAKRRVEELEDADHEDDVDYDGGEESSASLVDEKMSVDEDVNSGVHGNVGEGSGGNGGGNGSSEKKAAWLLMNLSVKDGEFGGAGGSGGSGGLADGLGDGLGGLGGLGMGRERFREEGRRIKRRRATSM